MGSPGEYDDHHDDHRDDHRDDHHDDHHDANTAEGGSPPDLPWVTPPMPAAGPPAAGPRAVEPPAGSRSGATRRVLAGVTIGAAVLATGGVAVAATHASAGASTPTPGAGVVNGETTAAAQTPGAEAPAGSTAGGLPGGPRGGHDGFGPHGPHGPDGIMGALHGTFVVPVAGGAGTTTEDLQTGKVTAVSGTSVSVTSTDAFARTYPITSATLVQGGQKKIADVKVGDTVTVVAADASKHVLRIDDRALAPSPAAGIPRPGRDGGPHGRPAGPPAGRGAEPAATPGTTPTSTPGATGS